MKDLGGPLILSIFPGIDLLGRAFEETWPGACVVRGPDPIWGGDIRSFRPPAGRFDGVIGGPPCQFYSSLSNLVRACGGEPRYGDLVPEYARVVRQAEPVWWLMENVPGAPDPYIEGYAAVDFVLDNAWLDGGDGLGQEQMRRRRFWFGVRGTEPMDLRQWIDYAALMLPAATGAVLSSPVNNSAEAKGRVPSVNARQGSMTIRARRPAVTAAHSGRGRRPKGGHLITYQLEEACRLQGLPMDFFRDAPFTLEGKRWAIAQGVPLPMGRAVARAVRRAVGAGLERGEA